MKLRSGKIIDYPVLGVIVDIENLIRDRMKNEHVPYLIDCMSTFDKLFTKDKVNKLIDMYTYIYNSLEDFEYLSDKDESIGLLYSKIISKIPKLINDCLDRLKYIEDTEPECELMTILYNVDGLYRSFKNY
jgi:hypothetical protein